MVASRRSKAPPRRDFAVAAHPCDQELITSFLSPRLISGDWSCEFIHDADVYTAHPADLTREHAAAVANNGEEAWYFFTAVRAKGGGRRARTVDSGEGCWHSEAGSKPVVAARRGRVGHRQSFSFVTKEGGQKVRSGWLMVELGLDDAGHDKLALCKVYFSPRAAKNKKAAAAATSSAPLRKRKTADENHDVPDDVDASVPARQRHRRAALTREADSESVDDDPVEEDKTLAGAGPEGLHEKNSAADDKVDEDPASFSWWLRNESSMMALMGMNSAAVDEPENEDPASFSWWLQNESSMMALMGMNSAAVDEPEDEDPASFSWWLRNESSMMALMGMNSAAVDEPEDEDPASFSWWLRNESSMMALMGINEAEFEQSSSTEVVVEGLPEIRLEAPDALPEWPPTGASVVRDENYRVCMWLTYDEMYDLPEVKEFLKPTLQQLQPPPPPVPGEAEIVSKEAV